MEAFINLDYDQKSLGVRVVHFIFLPDQFPCSTNKAAPFQAGSESLHCSATSDTGLENHLVGEKAGQLISASTQIC